MKRFGLSAVVLNVDLSQFHHIISRRRDEPAGTRLTSHKPPKQIQHYDQDDAVQGSWHYRSHLESSELLA